MSFSFRYNYKNFIPVKSKSLKLFFLLKNLIFVNLKILFLINLYNKIGNRTNILIKVEGIEFYKNIFRLKLVVENIKEIFMDNK